MWRAKPQQLLVYWYSGNSSKKPEWSTVSTGQIKFFRKPVKKTKVELPLQPSSLSSLPLSSSSLLLPALSVPLAPLEPLASADPLVPASPLAPSKFELAVESARLDYKKKLHGSWLFRQHGSFEHRILAGKMVEIIVTNKTNKHATKHLAEIVAVSIDTHSGKKVTLRHIDTNTFEFDVDLAVMKFNFVGDKYRPKFDSSSTDSKETPISDWIQCELCDDWFEIFGDATSWSTKSFQCSCFGELCRSCSPSPTDDPGCMEDDIKNVMCQQCGALHPTFKNVQLPADFVCTNVDGRQCGYARTAADEVLTTATMTAMTTTTTTTTTKTTTTEPPINPEQRVFSANFFCGGGLSTWGSRTAGIHSAVAFDAFSDVLNAHFDNHGDASHGGDPPFVLTTDTSYGMIEKYLRKQPPLACCHFVSKIGSNVSYEWYDSTTKKKCRLGKLTKNMITHILTIKRKLITDALPANTVVHFVGYATPPCYDVSTANPERTENFGFATMSSCFELLHHCFHTNQLATYCLEMVSHARHQQLVAWARKSSRKYSLVWDYILASDFNCPSNRERCFFKPRKAAWMTPARIAPNIVDVCVGSALVLKSKKFGLYGTTWGNLNGKTTAMSDRGFTITGEFCFRLCRRCCCCCCCRHCCCC